jgi:hypothetical protein
VGAALAVLTLAGHLAGQGALDPVGTSLVVVLALGLGWAASARAGSLARVLVVLLAGQAFLHLVLSFTTGHAHSSTDHTSPLAMVAGHALAALIAAGVIARADDTLRRWDAFLSATLGWALRPAAPPTRAASGVAPSPSPLRAPLQTLEHRVERRGPPAGHVLQPV